jgi:CheY-like chemotaxis protein
MKVLIVADDELSRKHRRVLLLQEGHSVIAASDGNETLEILDRESIDAAISDILMPRMDGCRFCY